MREVLRITQTKNSAKDVTSTFFRVILITPENTFAGSTSESKYQQIWILPGRNTSMSEFFRVEILSGRNTSVSEYFRVGILPFRNISVSEYFRIGILPYRTPSISANFHFGNKSLYPSKFWLALISFPPLIKFYVDNLLFV